MLAPGEVEAGGSEVQGHFTEVAVQNLRLAWERWKPRLKTSLGEMETLSQISAKPTH